MDKVMETLRLQKAGKSLARIRQHMKMSQEDLAKLIYCHRSRISRIETGEELGTPKFFHRCAQAMRSAELSWIACSLCDGLMSVPVLDQARIDTHPQTVLTILLRSLSEARDEVIRARDIFANKKSPDALSDEDHQTLETLDLKLRKLIPGIMQKSVSFQHFYDYDSWKGNELLYKHFLKRDYIEAIDYIDEKGETPAATGACVR